MTYASSKLIESGSFATLRNASTVVILIQGLNYRRGTVPKPRARGGGGRAHIDGKHFKI